MFTLSRQQTTDSEFPYRAVVFDWAWTLVDLDEEDDRRPLRRVFDYLAAENIDLPDFETALQKCRELFTGMIENSRRTHREALFEHVINYLLLTYDIRIENKCSVRQILEQYYDAVYAPRRVFDDVVPTLNALRQAGLPLGIVSNTTNPGFMKAVEQKRLGLDDYFAFSIYSSEVPYRKPHRSIFEAATANLKLPPAEVLYVGDNQLVDVGGAKAAGLGAAWINRDGEARLPDIAPDHELERLTDLLELFDARVSTGTV